MKQNLKHLNLFPKYACDENGFLYKHHGGDYYKPLQPKRHGMSGRDGEFKFYITVDALRYSCTQADLKKEQEKTKFRIEK